MEGKSEAEEEKTSGNSQENTDQKEENGAKDTNKEASKHSSKQKIDVLLKATGDAPIMKKKKWAVDKNKQVSYLIDFIKKYIKCDASESLFIYVNQTFVPPPDQLISNLYEVSTIKIFGFKILA
eukprot:Seg10271.1 transcript_id=Seg10271.1/GoldUCD/mRNA.D3Y31 product="Ubiquitin-like protein ATG12" protein_id=Seg10271.1/GoldUCD/D3Y31